MNPDSRIRHLNAGILGVNCYLVRPREDGAVYIIDPGGDADRILEEVRHFGDVPGYRILLTHGHFDHIGGLAPVAKALNVEKAWMDDADIPLYKSPLNSMEPYCPAVKELIPTEQPPENEDFQVIRIPGHTLGSVCYYFKELETVFTGDTLFHGGVGRTDLPGSGEYKDMLSGIREKLFTLPPETKVCPGHESFSTVGEEKAHNPYFA